MDASMKTITRHAFLCPIFGPPRDFLSSKLPTRECVLRCCFEERFKLSVKTSNKSVSFSKVAGIVAEKIKFLYEKASIPTVTLYRIVQLINAYHDSYYKIRKSYNRDKDKTSFKQKIVKFKLNASALFDVAACKCAIVVNCTCKKNPDACDCEILVNCKCERVKKIPALELRFMFLQRQYGLGKIGSLDLKVTKKLNKSIERKNRDLQPIKRSESELPNTEDEEYLEDKAHKSTDISDEEDEDVETYQVHRQKNPIGR